MVDRRGLGPRVRKDVGVQIPPRAPRENMDENNLDIIEEELKKKREPKKEIKKSGRSIFKLKEIIQEKSKKVNIPQENSKQDSTF